jgi:hypothetical protein
MLLEAIEQLVLNWWLGMSCDRRLLNSLGTKANFVVSRLVLDGQVDWLHSLCGSQLLSMRDIHVDFPSFDPDIPRTSLALCNV